jgi:hypothetical protein
VFIVVAAKMEHPLQKDYLPRLKLAVKVNRNNLLAIAKAVALQKDQFLGVVALAHQISLPPLQAVVAFVVIIGEFN